MLSVLGPCHSAGRWPRMGWARLGALSHTHPPPAPRRHLQGAGGFDLVPGCVSVGGLLARELLVDWLEKLRAGTPSKLASCQQWPECWRMPSIHAFWHNETARVVTSSRSPGSPVGDTEGTVGSWSAQVIAGRSPLCLGRWLLVTRRLQRVSGGGSPARMGSSRCGCAFGAAWLRALACPWGQDGSHQRE